MAFVTKFGFMDGWMDRIGLDWIELFGFMHLPAGDRAFLWR